MTRTCMLLVTLCAAMMAHTSLAATLNGQFPIRTFYANAGCSGSITGVSQFNTDCLYIPSLNVWARFGCSSDLVQGSTAVKVAQAIYASAGCTGTPTSVSDIGLTMGCSSYQEVTCSNTALAPSADDVGKITVSSGTTCAGGNVLGFGYLRSASAAICIDGTRVSCANSVATAQSFQYATCTGNVLGASTNACAAPGTGNSWSCTTYPPPTLNAQIPQLAYYAAADCSGTANAVMQYSTGCSQVAANTWARLGCSSDLVQGSTVMASAVYSSAGCAGTATSVNLVKDLPMGCSAGQKITCESTALAPGASDVAKVSAFRNGNCASSGLLGTGYVKSSAPACTSGLKFSCAGSVATIQEFAASNCSGAPASTTTSGTCAAISTGDLSWSCAALPKSGAASLLLNNNAHAQVLLLAFVAAIAALLA